MDVYQGTAGHIWSESSLHSGFIDFIAFPLKAVIDAVGSRRIPSFIPFGKCSFFTRLTFSFYTLEDTSAVPSRWTGTSAAISPLTRPVSSLRSMTTRWKRLIRRSLTTLHTPKRPTTSDRCSRSITQAELSGSPITGCHAGSKPPTHRPEPWPSTNLIKTSEISWTAVCLCSSVRNMLGFLESSTCIILSFTLVNSDSIKLVWNYLYSAFHTFNEVTLWSSLSELLTLRAQEFSCSQELALTK